MSRHSKQYKSTQASEDILSFLKVDGNGWDIVLFEDTAKATSYLCKHCQAVCCDAVELGCDHDDDQIFLYCEHCLRRLIQSNDNKCIIDNHENASINAARAVRRQISRLATICPFSAAFYKKRAPACPPQVIDTAGNDGAEEKEGVPGAPGGGELESESAAAVAQVHCEWSGLFQQLIYEHIADCVQRCHPTFALECKCKQLSESLKAKESELEEAYACIAEQEKQLQQKQSELDALKTNVSDKDTLQTQPGHHKIDDDEKHEYSTSDAIASSAEAQSVFNIPKENESVLRSIRTQCVLKYKGSTFNAYSWCTFGGMLSGEDVVTVEFETGYVGFSTSFGFGFATADTKNWNAWKLNPGAVIDCGGQLELMGEFKDINGADKKATKKQMQECEFWTGKANNTVVMSVDMKEQKGWIWNKANIDKKVEFRLPSQVVMVVMLSGVSDKVLTARVVRGPSSIIRQSLDLGCTSIDFMSISDV